MQMLSRGLTIVELAKLREDHFTGFSSSPSEQQQFPGHGTQLVPIRKSNIFPTTGYRARTIGQREDRKPDNRTVLKAPEVGRSGGKSR